MSPQEPFLSQLRSKIPTTFSSTMGQAFATSQRSSIFSALTRRMIIIVFSWGPYFLVLHSQTFTMPFVQTKKSVWQGLHRPYLGRGRNYNGFATIIDLLIANAILLLRL